VGIILRLLRLEVSVLIYRTALAGEGGGCTPTPLNSIEQLQCTLQLKGQIHSPYFISTTIYALYGRNCKRLREFEEIYISRQRCRDDCK
jgi:hypothetical protein